MTLSAEVVDLIRLGVLHDADQVAGVAQVAIVELEVGVGDVWVLVDVVYALGIEGAGVTFNSVNDVALSQQKLGQVASVLACDAGNERGFWMRLMTQYCRCHW
jgi:hypothetical protein